ncbi:MAG: FG-GAP-like repeat-containing protein [Gemmataceae bacterium]|nr:FG-GAP-like repeat-containing protein [Gemmataceae bacterium]
MAFRPRVEVLEDRTLLSFAAALNFNVGANPNAVVVGDLNADGHRDLILANALADNVSVLLGNGNGTFQTVVQYAAGPVPKDLTLGDFNGDGKLDLVTVNSFLGNRVSLLQGNGDGTFQPPVSFGTGMAPTSVTGGDFNADGQLDLVTANGLGSSISLLLGNGDGTFQTTFQYGTGLVPTTVTGGDFNADGQLDLITANGLGNSVSLLLGDGEGGFLNAVHFGTGALPVDVAVGDFNADGQLDLATANAGGNSVSLLLGNGNGAFQSAVHFDLGRKPASVTAGDFNGDGQLDLATANPFDNSVSVLLGTGAGSFLADAESPYAVGLLPAAVATADLNGDGTLDLAVANSGNTTVSVLLGSNNVLTHFGLRAPANSVAGTPIAVTVTALDANNNPDPLFTLPVHFTTSDASAVLPSDYTFQLTDAGTKTFTVILNTAGSHTITVTDPSGMFQGSVRVEVAPAPSSSTPTLTLEGPGRIVVGAPYTLELAASGLGTDAITQWTITWGDGTVDTLAGNPSMATHSYTRGPKVHTISATATVSAGLIGAANTVRVLVLVPKIVNADSKKVEPGQRITFRLEGIEATIASSPNDPDGVTVFEAVYQDDPQALEANGVAFYDLLVDSADDETTLTATFRFPAGAVNPTLKFFDEATQTYQVVQGSTLGPNSLLIDRVGNVIQVTLDRTSFPSIRDLGGTVFTIAVATPTSDTTSVLPAVALAVTSSPSTSVTDASVANSLVRTTTFVSTNQLTLALSASQDSQLTASRSVLGGGGEGVLAPPAPREEAEDHIWLRWLMELLQDVPEWLQRLRDAQELRQWLQKRPEPTEVDKLTEEEATPDVRSQSRQEVINNLFAQGMPEELTLLVESAPAPWLADPLARARDVEDQADWRWALAVALVGLAYRPRAARPEQRAALVHPPKSNTHRRMTAPETN